MKHRDGPTPRRGLLIVAAGMASLVACVATLAVALMGDAPAGVAIDTRRRAMDLLDAGLVREARAIWSDQLKRDPKNVQALRGMALAAREEADDEAAAMWLQRLVAIAKDDRPAWRSLGFALFRLGRAHESLAAAQTAMSLVPKGETDHTLAELCARIAMMPANPHDDALAGALAPRRGVPRDFDGSSRPFVPRPEPPDLMKLVRQKNPNCRD